TQHLSRQAASLDCSRRLCRATAPMPPNPSSMTAQVIGSGKTPPPPILVMSEAKLPVDTAANESRALPGVAAKSGSTDVSARLRPLSPGPAKLAKSAVELMV